MTWFSTEEIHKSRGTTVCQRSRWSPTQETKCSLWSTGASLCVYWTRYKQRTIKCRSHVKRRNNTLGREDAASMVGLVSDEPFICFSFELTVRKKQMMIYCWLWSRAAVKNLTEDEKFHSLCASAAHTVSTRHISAGAWLHTLPAGLTNIWKQALFGLYSVTLTSSSVVFKDFGYFVTFVSRWQ